MSKARSFLCPFFVAAGLLFTALGIIGAFVPGMPTTVFLIIALWLFARSSDRLQQWLWDHPRFGPPLRAWHLNRAISFKAKLAAVVTMTASLTVLALSDAVSLATFIALAVSMAAVAVWLVTRPTAAG